MLREHFAEYVAYALWAGFALCVFVFRRHVAPQDCSFIGAATLAASGLAIARHYRGPRLQPGQRVITDEQQRQIEAAITRAVVAGFHADGEPPQAVRAVASR